MNTIPNELKKAICNNELLIFVGAGLSYHLKNINDQPLQGWRNLVANILNDLKAKKYDVDCLLPLVDKYEPITVLDLIEKNADIPKAEIYKFTKDFFALKDDNDFELHRKLFKLSGKIITTNYDTAFEMAVPLFRRYKAYKGRNYELTTHHDKDAVLLFKLHGCSEDADSMVLFPSNYKNLYENTEKDAEHSLLVLKNIIFNKSILFIGVGRGDFQINHIFKEIKKLQGEYNQKHFMITYKPLDSSLNFLTPITIQDYSEIAAIIDKLITLKEASENEASKAVMILRKQLEDAQKEIEKLKNTNDKDKLLEREALKYFSRGVEYSLSNEPLKACDAYKTALELKPDFHEAFYNWGNNLGKLAQTKAGPEADALYQQAFDKFQKAIAIKPDFHEAYHNWGNALGNLAQTKAGPEADALYQQAFDKYQKAIEYGASAYNLSCIYALKGDKENALKYLDITLSNNEIEVDFVEKDEDWKAYLTDNEFIRLIKKYKKKTRAPNIADSQWQGR